jgi:hypothetical protein
MTPYRNAIGWTAPIFSPDLVLGTGISFADHSPHDLNGVPDQWQLFAVTRCG